MNVISVVMSLDILPFPVYRNIPWFSDHLQKSIIDIDTIVAPCIGDILSYIFANFREDTFNRTKVMIQEVELFE